MVAIGDSFMSGKGRASSSRARTLPRPTNADGPSRPTRRWWPSSSATSQTFACSGAKMENVSVEGVPQMPDSQPDVAGAQTQLADVAALFPDTDVRVVLVSIGETTPDSRRSSRPACCPRTVPRTKICTSPKRSRCRAGWRMYIARSTRSRETPSWSSFPTPTTSCRRRATGSPAARSSSSSVVSSTPANNTIARAAAEADVLVANTSGVFDGRTQCDEHPAANLVVLAPPGGTSILQRLSPANWVHGTMHPYDPGHALQADKLLPLVTRLTAACPTDDDCRSHCSGTPSEPVAALRADGSGLIVDTCGAPTAMILLRRRWPGRWRAPTSS